MNYDIWDDLGSPLAIIQCKSDLEDPSIPPGTLVYVMDDGCRMIREGGEWVRVEETEADDAL